MRYYIKKNDIIILTGIVLFSILLTGYYIIFNQHIGIYCSDVFIYLLNSLYFTGVNINSTATIFLSPIICYLTSLLMELGIKNATSIYIITGLFAIIGNIGFYLLLRTRFKELLSLTGTILYSTFAINLTWLANGSLDIPAVSISIWIVLALILAVNKSSKYYMFIIPLFVIGFFTKYSVILLLPPLALYYIYKKGFKIEKKDLKYIIIGLIIAAGIYFFTMHYVLKMGNGYFGVNSQISSGITGQQGSAVDPAYNTDITYYISNFLNFISSSNTTFINNTPTLQNPTILSAIIVLITLIGLFLYIKENNKKISLIYVIPLLIAIITFTYVSSTITIILTLLSLFLIGKDSESKNGLFMLSWILTYMIFFSYFSIKVNRYIITTIPPFIYLVVASIELIEKRINRKNIIPICLIILFIIQGFLFPFTFEDNKSFIAQEEISNYIIDNNPDYAEKMIGVYNMRPYHWYLGKNVTGIESGDTPAIDSSNVSYYISNTKLENLTNYSEINKIENLYLYKKEVIL